VIIVWRRLAGTVLGVPSFRRLWAGHSIATVGDQVFPVAVTVGVLDTHGGATAVGLVLGARWLGLVVFASVGGVWADRVSRIRLIRASTLVSALIVASLAVLPHLPSLPVLAAAVFAAGAAEAFLRPAETALLPGILPGQRLAAGNALLTISYRAASVIGPGLGALAVAAAGGPRLAFAVDAVALVVALGCFLRVREPARATVPVAERAGLVAEVAEGVRAVRARPWIAATLLVAMVQVLLLMGPEQVLLPVIGRRTFGTDGVYAASLMAMSLGALAGGLVAMRWRPRQPGLVSWLGCLPLALMPLALLYPVGAWTLPAAYFVAGLCFEPFMVYWPTALQREVPRALLARVSSLDWMTSLALLPLGMALTGPVVRAVGTTPVLWVGVAACVIPIPFVLRVPGMRTFSGPGPAGAASEAVPAGTLTPSG